jgi:hypothetical protein
MEEIMFTDQPSSDIPCTRFRPEIEDLIFLPHFEHQQYASQPNKQV